MPSRRHRSTDRHRPTAAAWEGLKDGYARILDAHPKAGHPRTVGQLATLGTGNHFVELCLDEQQRVWVMLHSGSRGPGNKLGTYFIELAKSEMRRWFINLPDADLAYLAEGSAYFYDYVRAVSWAQSYARINRQFQRFTLADHAKATAHVECRKDEGVLDETPGAYKNIDAVMAAQSDLVEIMHTLRQVVCVKG